MFLHQTDLMRAGAARDSFHTDWPCSMTDMDSPPPHGEWRPPASALGRDAERSAGRVVVEVIDTSNHFTELATETTATDCKRGFDV